MRSHHRSIVHCVSLLAVAAVLGFASGARAQGGPCASDVAKFCPNVAPGEGARMSCLRAHEADLSPACRQHMAAMQGAKEKIQEACHADAQRLCKGVEPGGGRMMGCLESHEAELSDACKRVVAKHEQMRETMRACQTDAERFCAGMSPAEGRLMNCLKSHRAELSEGCRSAMAAPPSTMQPGHMPPPEQAPPEHAPPSGQPQQP
jgi:hypothetical protein